jgi:hypothetical protein
LADFDQYWDDPIKHDKRLNYWLPHVKALVSDFQPGRSMKYFTLCAPPMIDVFMLVHSGLLNLAPETGAIEGVYFCERYEPDLMKIREMLVRESGFLGELEEIALFQDNEFTKEFSDDDSIALALDLGGEDFETDEERGGRLREKRNFLRLRETFPHDFINLDFCGHWYKLNDNFKLNAALERFLEWQGNEALDGTRVNEFLLSMTCRHDQKFPRDAEERLSQLVDENRKKSKAYDQQLRLTRKHDVQEWLKRDRLDFFLAAWPKDIARMAQGLHWRMEIVDYVYYKRRGDKGPYDIICLIARFSRVKPPNYLRAALHALDQKKRTLLPLPGKRSKKLASLRRSLLAIWKIRNAQAKRVGQDLLPRPKL